MLADYRSAELCSGMRVLMIVGNPSSLRNPVLVVANDSVRRINGDESNCAARRVSMILGDDFESRCVGFSHQTSAARFSASLVMLKDQRRKPTVAV
jgi:hypothetical protein